MSSVRTARTRATAPASKSARTRERILDAAAYVLGRNGYAATHLGEIADRAQVQASAIYYYFDSREQLIEEVIWLGVHRVHAHVSEVLSDLPESTSPLERILVGVEAHLSYVLNKSDFTTASIRNAGQVPASARERQIAEEQDYVALWRRMFEEADAENQLHEELDLRLIRMLVLGALNWATEWWQQEGESLDTLIKNARILVERGVSRNGSQTIAEPLSDNG